MRGLSLDGAAIGWWQDVLEEPPNSTTDVVEAVGEIQIEEMGRPFNADKVVLHFYGEPPPVGTKLYAAPPDVRKNRITEEKNHG
jgi:hypothetical protein